MTINSSKSGTLQAVKWQDVAEAVAKVNPKFAEIINQIYAKHKSLLSSDKFILYKARYPFGSYIIKSDQFFVPYEGELMPLTDPRIPKSIQFHLGYNDNGIPMGINLEHSSELYLASKERIISFNLLTKGRLFGLWVALQNTLKYSGIKMWSMVAGSRCISVLPKITDLPSYQKLSHARGITQDMPRDLWGQCPVLAKMAQHPEFPNPWFTEVLFFTHNWLNQRHTPAWLNFWLFLYEQGWQKTEYWRIKFGYDFIWDSFVKDLSRRGIYIKPHIVDIIKHIIMVTSGELPGFSPAIDEEEGPIEGFETDLIHIYGLKNFAPTIMVPKHLSTEDGRFVYLSLQFSTHFESTPKQRKVNSTLSDLREIMRILQKFRMAILEGEIEEAKGTALFECISKARFDFFHNDVRPNDMIRPITEMVDEDETLLKCGQKFGRNQFSEISPFIRGCIRISLM